MQARAFRRAAGEAAQQLGHRQGAPVEARMLVVAQQGGRHGEGGHRRHMGAHPRIHRARDQGGGIAQARLLGRAVGAGRLGDGEAGQQEQGEQRHAHAGMSRPSGRRGG